MDKIRKFELMEKIVHELEDLRHSQQAIIQKLGKIEVDNIDNLDTIAAILEDFADQTTTYSSQNNIQALKEQEEIDKLSL
jgi:hypothetical protein